MEPTVLYANPNCPFSHRAVFALALCGEELRERSAAEIPPPPHIAHVPLVWQVDAVGKFGPGHKIGRPMVGAPDLQRITQLREAYVKDINPRGPLPALKTKGVVVTESDVVAEFFDSLAGTSLMGKDAYLRAKILMAMKLFTDVVSSGFDLLRNKEKAMEQAKLAAFSGKLAKFASSLGTQGPFCFGDKPTMADVHSAPFLWRFGMMFPFFKGYDLWAGQASGQRLPELIESQAALPAFQEVLPIAAEDAVRGLCWYLGLLWQGPVVGVASLTRAARGDEFHLPQPPQPKFKVALVEVFVPSLPHGGADKLTNGHRFDSIPLANGLIGCGISCQIVNYVKDEHDEFFKTLSRFDGVLVRCIPGQIAAAGGDQRRFDDSMTALAATIPVWPTPGVVEKMGAKDALCQIKDMDIGLPDTFGYSSPEDLRAGFRKSIAFQPRVVKQNRGDWGEGIWIVSLKSRDYCSTFGEREAADDELLVLMEASDNHEEEHSVAEFLEFCVGGRSAGSGEWESTGAGRYFDGGVDAGGQMVDQRYLPRISEGEARFLMVGADVSGIEHYVYVGGVSGETKTTLHAPDAPEFAGIRRLLEAELGTLVRKLGLAMKDLPLLWAADFIPVDNHRSSHVVGEFNCACLGITGYLDSRGKDTASLSLQQREAGDRMCQVIGRRALLALQEASDARLVDSSSLTKDFEGLEAQRQQPRSEAASVDI